MVIKHKYGGPWGDGLGSITIEKKKFLFLAKLVSNIGGRKHTLACCFAIDVGEIWLEIKGRGRDVEGGLTMVDQAVRPGGVHHQKNVKYKRSK